MDDNLLHPFTEDIERGNGDIELKALNEDAEAAEKKAERVEKKREAEEGKRRKTGAEDW